MRKGEKELGKTKKRKGRNTQEKRVEDQEIYSIQEKQSDREKD